MLFFNLWQFYLSLVKTGAITNKDKGNRLKTNIELLFWSERKKKIRFLSNTLWHALNKFKVKDRVSMDNLKYRQGIIFFIGTINYYRAM